MHRLSEVFLIQEKKKLSVVPISSVRKPTADYCEPVKFLFLMLMEQQKKNPIQAFRELMKIDEFQDVADDIKFQEFADLVDPAAKGYRACEIYRMIESLLEGAKDKGVSDEQLKEWFEQLEPKTAA